jgi:outer membrane biosynthesis protein TonB
MQAETLEPAIVQDNATVLSQPLVVALTDGEARAVQMRRAASAAGVFGACVMWFLTLGRLQATTEGLPWYITSGLIAVVCAHNVARPRPTQFNFRGRTSLREPLSLMETWSIAYLSAALLLYAWVLMHALMPSPPPPKVVHVVDIQLTSPSDFANRNSPMPGSEEQPELHKRQTDRTTSQGSLTANKIAAVARKSEQSSVEPLPEKIEVKKEQAPPKQEQKKSAAPPSPQIIAANAQHAFSPKLEREEKQLFVKPMPVVQASQPCAPAKPATSGKPSQQPLFEEVQPPEMVEMLENDGATDATTVFESGGSSEGGKGAKNDLSTYIKELHKRIKYAWSPPRGQTRRAKVLFRVKKDGHLAFLKLVTSSGDTDTDEAAIKAVTSAVKSQSLPHTYNLPYLDVQYTFNYTADEIKEVNPLAN